MVPEFVGDLMESMIASPEASPSTSRDECWYTEKTGRLFGYNEIVAPWSTKRYSLSIEGLHEEIKDIFQWLRPCRLEEAIRLEVFRKVRSAIKERWKNNNVRVSVFGSLRTRLFLPTSDIDVLVECDEWKDSDIMSHCMQETANYLEEKNLAKSVAVFSDAYVPIVKMVEKDTLVNVDISFNTAQGVKAADYIEKRDTVPKYSVQVKEEFPVVEPLILVLKQFLILRRLNTTYTGGLSSYGLILMLINFLHTQNKYVNESNQFMIACVIIGTLIETPAASGDRLPTALSCFVEECTLLRTFCNFMHYGMPVRRKHPYSAEVNLGELLMRFFEVYAQEVNYERVGISVMDMRYTLKEQHDVDKKQAMLSIEDPLLINDIIGYV
ncbi:nucleotidyltransferase domain protein [Dictyocaulus viviparus]|uniref:Nucleotidyltransferase domain protein n=1 Tax=Dictyocaulus viviparus TaxID=29172 RepID=A0A0D8Y4Q0_DICVI|nr:nucleotidyltransferase domain protein [Dictyocaulus viviparus]